MKNLFQEMLNTRPSKYSSITNKEIFNSLFIVLLKWLKTKELEIITDITTCKYDFYLFICNAKPHSLNVQRMQDDFFDMKYSEDVVDLFINMQEITKSHCSLFLHEKERTSDSLLEFIFSHFKMVENQDNDDDDSENFVLDYY